MPSAGNAASGALRAQKERFIWLFHHLSIELPRQAFFALNREAAPDVGGLTWQDYEADLSQAEHNFARPLGSSAFPNSTTVV